MNQGNQNYKEYNSSIPQSNPPTSERNLRLLSALAYIVFFVPLLLPDVRNNPFARHHANNGIILQIGSIIFICCVSNVISFFISFILSFFGVVSNRDIFVYTNATAQFIVLIVQCSWYIVYLVFVVLGIIKAYSGEYFNIPLLSRIKILNR